MEPQVTPVGGEPLDALTRGEGRATRAKKS